MKFADAFPTTPNGGANLLSGSEERYELRIRLLGLLICRPNLLTLKGHQLRLGRFFHVRGIGGNDAVLRRRVGRGERRRLDHLRLANGGGRAGGIGSRIQRDLSSYGVVPPVRSACVRVRRPSHRVGPRGGKMGQFVGSDMAVRRSQLAHHL